MLGPDIVTERAACTITTQLLTSYLTGFGLAAVIGLTLFPRTCRALFRRQSRLFLGVCQKLLEAEQKAFESALPRGDPAQIEPSSEDANLSNVSNLGTTVAAIMAQLTDEIASATNEIAMGYQSPDMLKGILLHLQALLIPLLGISRFYRRDQEIHHGSRPSAQLSSLRQLTLKCFEETRQVLEKGAHHVLLTVLDERGSKVKEFKRTQDGSEDSHPPGPGQPGFYEYLDGRLQKFEYYRQDELKSFQCHENVAQDGAQNHLSEHPPEKSQVESDDSKEENHCGLMEVHVKEFQQLVFLQYLLRSLSKATAELVQYSDKIQIRSNTPRSIFFPRFNPWKSSTRSVAESGFPVGPGSNDEVLAELELKRDPEHRLPISSLESLGDRVRYVLRGFLSDSSKFGLRVAAATVSLGIIGFLPQTRQFFVEYRLAWAMIMIPISMSPTSGNSINGFAARVLGTVFAMVMAYANWYIVNGHAAGVVVFFFISMLVYYYFLLRYPQFNILFLLAAVNHILIVGKFNIP